MSSIMRSAAPSPIGNEKVNSINSNTNTQTFPTKDTSNLSSSASIAGHIKGEW